MGVAVITSRCGLVPFRAQGGALLHAKAVLLIHHDELQVGKRHRVLDQGMRADDDLDLPGGKPDVNLLLFPVRGIAHQQADLTRLEQTASPTNNVLEGADSAARPGWRWEP